MDDIYGMLKEAEKDLRESVTAMCNYGGWDYDMNIKELTKEMAWYMYWLDIVEKVETLDWLADNSYLANWGID